MNDKYQSSIKILTGHSLPGGSTKAHINLTNELNKSGVNCVLYGPHSWHLNQCNGKLLKDLAFNDFSDDDIIIVHYLDYKADQLPHRKLILSCHETSLFPIRNYNYSIYDNIHYVSEYQKNWHAVDHPYFIIPPIAYSINWNNPKNNIAGVIGTIDPNKRTHLSIERALSDGFKTVMLYGIPADPAYYDQFVRRYVEAGQAVLAGYVEDQEAMYNSIEKVFHSSIIECCPMVKSECLLSGIPYSEYDPLPNDIPMLAQEIVGNWLDILSAGDFCERLEVKS